jgi:hypothetical protein
VPHGASPARRPEIIEEGGGPYLSKPAHAFAEAVFLQEELPRPPPRALSAEDRASSSLLLVTGVTKERLYRAKADASA